MQFLGRGGEGAAAVDRIQDLQGVERQLHVQKNRTIL
jgi:hypothetical protein